MTAFLIYEKMVNFVALIFAFGIIAIDHLLHHGFTETTMTFMNLSKPKGTLKTIKSDDGDIIDCVDIYKQITFNSPLIKSLQLNVNLDKRMKRDNSLPKNKLVQGWHRNGECPFQTVPILRPRRRQTTSFKPLPAIKYLNINKHEYAVVWNKGGEYYGASAKFSVQNPRTEKNDFSLSQLWVVNLLNINSIEAGWMVYPKYFGDNQTRFFIYWTRDGYNKTGCYNLKCPGFVQTSRTFSLGSPLESPISAVYKKSSEIQVSIYKDKETGHWLLELENELIGYWPRQLFDSLDKKASHISWGGEVFNSNTSTHHTTTEMGNGHFPGKGSLRSSHVRNLLVKNMSNKWISPEWSLKKDVTKPECYSLNIPNFFQRKKDWGVHFFYGGPGFSSKCA